MPYLLGRLLCTAICIALFPASTIGAEPKKKKTNGPVFGVPTAPPIPNGFRGTVYRLSKGASWLPDFKTLRPVGELYTTSLNYPLRPYGDEWFAINYEARFYVRKAGTYTFVLGSDDGAQLHIDGKLIIDNDGVHEDRTKEREVVLDAGLHYLRVPYFQGPVPYVALVLEVQPPGGKKRIFDTDDFAVPVAETPEERPTLKRKH